MALELDKWRMPLKKSWEPNCERTDVRKDKIGLEAVSLSASLTRWWKRSALAMHALLLLGALLAPALALRSLWNWRWIESVSVFRGLIKHRPAQPRGVADPPEMWFDQVVQKDRIRRISSNYDCNEIASGAGSFHCHRWTLLESALLGEPWILPGCVLWKISI